MIYGVRKNKREDIRYIADEIQSEKKIEKKERKDNSSKCKKLKVIKKLRKYIHL